MSDTESFNRWDLDHSWHPFSQMQEYRSWPLLQVERGEGCWLWDTEGNRYLDSNASIWTNTFGHNDPDLNAALQEQLGRVAHSTYLGLSHPRAAELAHRLTALAPKSLQRAFFSDNGSNAIEIALKLSYQYWQLKGQPKRKRIIGMEGGYHGDTVGTMAAGASGRFHERFSEWFPDNWHFPAPRCHRLAGKVLHEDVAHSLQCLENYLQQEAENVACLVLEPFVQGAAGMMQQPSDFLRSVEQICRRFGIHLILDEVFVAFGRLGSLYACTEESVVPDFLCLGKGIGAGYLPLAATLVQEDIYSAFLGKWEDDRTFFHGHTFTANPLACSVALKNLEKLHSLMESGRLEQIIEYFGQALAGNFDGHPNVGQVRQYGLSAAIDLQPVDGSEVWPESARMGWRVCLAARKNGLLLRPLGNSLLLVPPLVIQPDEIDFLCKQTRLSIHEAISDYSDSLQVSHSPTGSPSTSL